ncbi:hypothetical protein BU23DRAFT_553786 [Bimuria novae-zelandiae CBS 107.79]|uniref:Uncharacterized protein n=1 Tax=Bimuria novae-zelandiae CBS 107.79 TaxID=1447943 RepID=A0A6A5VFG4_9PLEO|nr:hypothetical protein BU23DRAFT_553786 [Bimuria novae-zelandiae CBS 107.79]
MQPNGAISGPHSSCLASHALSPLHTHYTHASVSPPDALSPEGKPKNPRSLVQQQHHAIQVGGARAAFRGCLGGQATPATIRKPYHSYAPTRPRTADVEANVAIPSIRINPAYANISKVLFRLFQGLHSAGRPSGSSLSQGRSHKGGNEGSPCYWLRPRHVTPRARVRPPP